MSNFQTVKFGDVVRNVRDTEKNPLESGITRYVGLGDLDPESIQLKRWGSLEEDETTFTRLFREGQMLFGRRRAYQRKAALAPFDGICSGDIIVMEAIPHKLLPELLPFLIHTDGFFNYAMRTSAGSLSPRTKWSHLAKYEFALPPLDEQRRIAEILWAVEDTVERWLCVLGEVQQSKRVTMRQLFNIDGVVEIPLGNVGQWFSGGTPYRSNEDYWNGDIPWASPKDMKVDMLHDTEEHVTVEGVEAGTRLVPKDSIFIVTRGMILAHTFPIALAAREMAFNQDMKALVTADDFLPKYIFYWLQNQSLRVLRMTSVSSHGTKRLPTDEIFSLKVPCLSNSQQEKIVEILRGRLKSQSGDLASRRAMM
ncbi:MAG: restriction endonuclease subunit S [Chloroflexota bacterium]